MRVEHKEGMLTTESMRGDLWLFAFSVVCINEATALGDGHFVPVAASNADAVAGRGPNHRLTFFTVAYASPPRSDLGPHVAVAMLLVAAKRAIHDFGVDS